MFLMKFIRKLGKMLRSGAGGREVFLGAFCGMVVGMMQATAGIGPADAAWSGAAVGILSLAFTYRLQSRLHGEVE